MKGRKGWCNHYNGLAGHTHCAAGVEYASVMVQEPHARSYPCVTTFNKNGEATCPKLEMPSAEQIAERKASLLRRMDSIAKGVSPCCHAAIDESRVIQSGRHKGHGARFCSQCGELLFMV